MSRKKRGPRRFVTLVQGIETFGIDLNEFTHYCAKKFASTATIIHEATHETVLIQGQIDSQVQQLLIKEHNIPLKYILITTKDKKKQR